MGNFIVGQTHDGMVLSNDDAMAEYIVGQMEHDPDGDYAIVGQLMLPRLNLSPSTAARVNQRIRLNPALMRNLSAASSPAMSALRATLRPAVAVQPAAQPHVVEVDPGPVGRSSLGLDSGATLIAAGATVPLTQNLVTYFRPERLSVPAVLADFFVIEDIRLGNVSLFAGTQGQPASVFVPGGVESPNLKRESGNPGMPLTVTITNIDVVGHRFRAAMFGSSSQPGGCR